MDLIENQTPIEGPMPWHKPELHRLDVALDTQNLFGSGPDAAAHTTD